MFSDLKIHVKVMRLRLNSLKFYQWNYASPSSEDAYYDRQLTPNIGL